MKGAICQGHQRQLHQLSKNGAGALDKYAIVRVPFGSQLARVPMQGRTAMAKRNTSKIGRDAKSGQFIPVKEAQKRPSTTTVETVKHPKKGK